MVIYFRFLISNPAYGTWYPKPGTLEEAQELGGRFSDDGDLIDASDSPRGPDSLWLRRDASFNISTCPQDTGLAAKKLKLSYHNMGYIGLRA